MIYYNRAYLKFDVFGYILLGVNFGNKKPLIDCPTIQLRVLNYFEILIQTSLHNHHQVIQSVHQ